VVQSCRFFVQPDSCASHLCTGRYFRNSNYMQVEQADADSSICDVVLQGSASDCCNAALQILHHASAAHSHSNDIILGSLDQAVWQLNNQVSSCMDLQCLTCPCKSYRGSSSMHCATLNFCLHFMSAHMLTFAWKLVCRRTSSLCLRSSSAACLWKPWHLQSPAYICLQAACFLFTWLCNAVKPCLKVSMQLGN